MEIFLNFVLIVTSLVYNFFKENLMSSLIPYFVFLFSFGNYSVAYINLIGISADPGIKSLLKFWRTVIYLV